MDSLNAWQKKVAMRKLPGIPTISHPLERKLLDFFTSHLDREIISYNMIVASHKKRVDNILLKGRELLEASSSLGR